MSLFAPPEHFFDTPVTGPGRSSRWFFCIAYALAFVVFKICFRYRIEGKEHLRDQDGSWLPAVIAGNHASMIDPLFPWLATGGRVRFLAKSELFEKSTVLSQMLARAGAIPVKRGTADRTAIKRAVAAVKRGEFCGIYPEGTRVHDEEDRSRVEAHAGAVLIANMADCRIVPVGVSGTDRVKPEGARFIHFPNVVCRFGDPVDPRAFDVYPKRERAARCVDEVMRRSYCLRNGTDPGPFIAPLPPEDDAVLPAADSDRPSPDALQPSSAPSDREGD